MRYPVDRLSIILFAGVLLIFSLQYVQLLLGVITFFHGVPYNTFYNHLSFAIGCLKDVVVAFLFCPRNFPHSS